MDTPGDIIPVTFALHEIRFITSAASVDSMGLARLNLEVTLPKFHAMLSTNDEIQSRSAMDSLEFFGSRFDSHPVFRMQAAAGSAAATGSLHVQPVLKEVTEWDDFTGRLEPIKSVEVRARVSGYLDSIHFKDGQEVKTGDLLFVIDPRPYEAEAERARAELKRAEAQRNLGLQNLQRAEKLMQGSTIAQEQYDTRRNEYDIAAANVLEAQAAAKAAELNLEFTQVKAPIDGRISRRYADEGNLITGGSTQSTLLTTIVPFNPLYATFDADERLVLKYTRLDLSGQRRSSREAAKSCADCARGRERVFARGDNGFCGQPP